MIKQIYVNLCVKDLDKTVKFFTHLGFTFNAQFTNKDATCMILGENIYAMFLVPEFFKTFIPGKEIADAAQVTEVINAMSVESREKVDELITKAIEAGGSEYRTTRDYGWMYGRAFQDLDGHIWEPSYMDESKIPTDPTVA